MFCLATFPLFPVLGTKNSVRLQKNCFEAREWEQAYVQHKRIKAQTAAYDLHIKWQEMNNFSVTLN